MSDNSENLDAQRAEEARLKAEAQQRQRDEAAAQKAGIGQKRNWKRIALGVGIVVVIGAVVLLILAPWTNKEAKKPSHAATGVCAPLSRFASQINRRFGLVTTSTTGGGHAANSYHYRGMAMDISGSSGNMYRAANYIKNTRARGVLLEAIHRPNLSIKSGHAVSPSFWGSAVWFNHGNHIHIAGCNPALGFAATGSGRRASTHGDRLPLSIARRSKGHNVCTAQKRLNRIRGKSTRKIKVDCRYGRTTRNRVLGFQRARHIKTDGVIGVRTWTALKRAST